MTRILSQLLATPGSETAKTMAKVVSDAFMIAVSILIIVRVAGGFALPEGNASLYFDGAIALLLFLWFGLMPALFFVTKMIGNLAKDEQDV